MTENRQERIRRWAEETKLRMVRLYRESLLDLLEACQNSAQSITSGGVLIEGRIPVLSSDLINSLVSEVNGAGVAEGPASYSSAISAFDPNDGDTARFSWTMEYAHRVNSGFSGTDSLGRTFDQPGWQYVSYNVAQWSSIVAMRAATV